MTKPTNTTVYAVYHGTGIVEVTTNDDNTKKRLRKANVPEVEHDELTNVTKFEGTEKMISIRTQ